MGLNAALVDEGRQIKDQALAKKVEGTTIFTSTTGSWFRCRLTWQAAPERDDDQGARRRTVRSVELMTGVKDKDRGVLDFSASDKIEVRSKRFGTAVYEVTGDPEPISKKKRVLGWTVPLSKVDEHSFREAVG